MPHRISLALIPLAILTAPAPASAQYPDGTMHVDWAPATPAITRVALRNDSAFFHDPDAADGSAYVFDRRARTFARVRAPADIPEPFNSRRYVEDSDWVTLVDSLELAMVELPDGSRSHVVRVAGKRNIPLRGVRVAAEQRWRRARGLPATPPIPDGDMRYVKEDWSPIDVMSFAVDSAAIWLGLYSPHEYEEFALGGMLRIDRRTHEVVVIADTAVMHATIGQIVADGKGGYLLRVDGAIARFDTATRRIRRLDVGVHDVQRFALANDTLFVAGTWAIAVADLRSGAVISRGFELKIVGDSAIHALADSTVEPTVNFRAALGVARRLPISPLGAWMRAAVGRVRPVSIEYYFPGDRQSVRLGVDSTDTTSERSVYRDEDLEGPTGLYVDSLTHPSLRPFLREAIRSGDMYVRLELAELLLAASDTAAAPYLRAVFDSVPYPYSARIAVALALLGDSTGHRWIRQALVDSLRASASMDPTRPIHHFVFNAAMSVKDPANVPRLQELLADPRYAPGAAEILIAYVPSLIDALARDTAAYSAAVIALVRLTGTGVEAMPVGVGTAASRAEARQWWTSWYARSRANFQPVSKDVGERAATLMAEKIRRPDA